jgi:hypothetical protein
VSEIRLTRWTGLASPACDELNALLANEDLTPYWWSNGPGDRYAPHTHPYHKVLYCGLGSITFVAAGGTEFTLAPGDRLDIPADTSHSAIVGNTGVTCVEAVVDSNARHDQVARGGESADALHS